MAQAYRNLGFFFLLLLALVLAGFTPRIPDTPFFGYFSHVSQFGHVPLVIHVHAAVAVAWFLLLIAQTFLIRSNRRDIHRLVGRASPILVALFLVTAVQVMKHFVAQALLQYPREVVLSALSQSFTGLSLFLTFYVAAIMRRRHLHQHVAFMIAAALAGATPGLARFGLYFIGGFPGILAVVAATYATLIAFMLYAKFKLRQPILKGPYPIIILMFLLAHSMDIFGSRTAWWLWIADRIISFW